MGRHDVGVGLVVADTQPDVALAIKHDERRRVGDQHVDAQVELLAFQQQRIRYVPAQMPLVSFDMARSPYSAVSLCSMCHWAHSIGP